MFFHYTSREYAERIVADGWLRPGERRKVYLTRELYEDASTAEEALAIVGKSADIVFIIPEDRVGKADAGGRSTRRADYSPGRYRSMGVRS